MIEPYTFTAQDSINARRRHATDLLEEAVANYARGSFEVAQAIIDCRFAGVQPTQIVDIIDA